MRVVGVLFIVVSPFHRQNTLERGFPRPAKSRRKRKGSGQRKEAKKRSNSRNRRSGKGGQGETYGFPRNVRPAGKHKGEPKNRSNSHDRQAGKGGQREICGFPRDVRSAGKHKGEAKNRSNSRGRQAGKGGQGETYGFPRFFCPQGKRSCRNHFCRGVYVAKIPRPQPPGAASPVRRLVGGDSQGGACSPLKARRAIRYAPPSRHSLRGPPRRGCPRPGHGASPPDSHSHARYTARS